MMLPGILVYMFAFFGVLHCWFNMWAELTRFADRQFYKDVNTHTHTNNTRMHIHTNTDTYIHTRTCVE